MDETGRSFLKGQHLTLLPFPTYPSMEIVRNESGHILEIKGFAMEWLDWVVRSINLTYTMLLDDVPDFYEDDTLTGRKGTLSYLIEKKADVGVGTFVMSTTFAKMVDYSYPFESTGFACMIPAPESTTYLGATWLPFSLTVWVVLLVSITLIVSLFYGFYRIESKTLGLNSSKMNGITQFYKSVDYTFRTLMSQGASCIGSMLCFRVLAGTWVLASFLLVNYYCSILTSFFTSPNYQPIIKSIYDLPKNPNIKVTTSAFSAPIYFFRDAEEGIEKYVNSMWKNDPELLCKNPRNCLGKVLQGFSIHIDVYPAILEYIGADVEKAGSCRFTVAKEKYRRMLFAFTLTKGSPFTEMFSQEFLKAEAAGLRYSIKTKHEINAARCIGNNKRGADDGKPLTLKNLSSAFLLLPAGCLLSIFIFCVEKKYSPRVMLN